MKLREPSNVIGTATLRPEGVEKMLKKLLSFRCVRKIPNWEKPRCKASCYIGPYLQFLNRTNIFRQSSKHVSKTSFGENWPNFQRKKCFPRIISLNEFGQVMLFH